MKAKSGPRRRRGLTRRNATVGGDPAQALERLRELIVGPEQVRLTEVEQRPVTTPETVGTLLPEAITEAATLRPEELAIALEPTLTSSVRTVARKDAELFGEILAPTIGAAVRAAVAEAIAALLQRFNEALDRSLSVRSIQWRIEAVRTGRPFAEVVLLRTLVYRVDQVFLIHSDTGLLLHHVQRAAAAAGDAPEQVAAMMSAIDAFASEAFRGLAPGAHLRHFKVGDLTLWVERDPFVTLAALVRGTAPEAFAEVLRETRKRILLAHHAELASFRADVAPFATARPVLEECLRVERRPPPRRAQVVLALAVVVLLALTVVLLGQHYRGRAEEARQRAAYASALAESPGLVVTDVWREDGRLQISGFRDPLAEAPATVLARRGLAPAALHFAPFFSSDPLIITRRAKRALQAPPTVELAFEGGTLTARGVAPAAWIEQARERAPLLTGVEQLGEDELRPSEVMAKLAELEGELEATTIHYPRGVSRAGGSQRPVVDRVVSQARRLTTLAANNRLAACITMVGRADAVGTAEQNRSISEARATELERELTARGVSPEHLRTEAAGVAEGVDASEARTVMLSVAIGAGDPEAGCQGSG